MRAAQALLLLSLTLAAARPAAARAQSELAYRLDEAYSTATRFVRVDKNCKLTDKDAEAAFVIFECPAEENKVSRGSIEIIRTQVRGQDGVRIQISLPDEGRTLELRWLELLERKLRDERGTQREAPKQPKPAPPAAAPDNGSKPPF